MTQHYPLYIPYRQTGEPPRRAGIAPVEVTLDNLTDNQVQMVGHLCAAAEMMNPVFRDQFFGKTEDIRRVTEILAEQAAGEVKTALEHYHTMLNLQNSPWSLLPRKNHLLDADRAAVAELADKAGIAGDFAAVAPYMFDDMPLSDKANFYPGDLSEEELEALGPDARLVNTSVVRDDTGAARVLYNEERYRGQCRQAVDHLIKARALSDDAGFQIYLDAKIEEMTTGSARARRLADYLWVRHNSPVDIIISTAIEVYTDAWKNAKGSAAAAVTIRDTKADALLKQLIDAVPWLEANAPWAHRRTEIDPETLPRLKFVDVVNWTGDYVTGPMTTIAQSLPNDEWVGKNVGTVNMVYSNTGRAVHSITGSVISSEFLASVVMAKHGDGLFDAGQIHSALHEIGHTTGMQDAEHQGEPRDYLEAEYSALEETRAELFGMWAADELARREVLTPEVAEACHYSMLMSMLMSLKFEPAQAHTRARNMMWHYFDKKGVILRVQEDGRTRYSLNMETLMPVVTEMLALIGNLKSAGDKAGATALRETYCYTDDLREEIEERTKDAPLGRGLVFPQMAEDNGAYRRELTYASFARQRKFRL